LHEINSIYQASVGMSMRLFNVSVLLSEFQRWSWNQQWWDHSCKGFLLRYQNQQWACRPWYERKVEDLRSICNMNVIQWIRTVVIFSSVCGLVFFSFFLFL
jgi:hypothetical protein